MFPALLGSWKQVLGTNRPPLNEARLIAGFFLPPSSHIIPDERWKCRFKSLWGQP